MHQRTRTPRRSAPAAVAALGLGLTLAACGNSSQNADTPDVATSSSSVNTGKPGATKALRSACIGSNDRIVSANDAWNKAVDSREDADLAAAATTMTKLAESLRQQAEASKNASFRTKAETTATKVEVLTKAKTPTKTVDTDGYNRAVNDLTAYCSQMFPQPASSAA